MNDDRAYADLKKEVAELRQIVKNLQNQVIVLSTKVDQQRFINDQVNNNIRRVAAGR